MPGEDEPGHSKAVVVADVNTNWLAGGGSRMERPFYSNHVNLRGAFVEPPESNVLYGDGNVVSRKLANYVLRSFSLGTYTY